MEKRTCRRKIRRLNISFSDGVIEYSGISSDFSCSGIFIRTRKGFREGTILKMEIGMEDGKKLHLTGVVKRTIKTQVSHYKNGMGVEITSAPPEYNNFINDLYKHDSS